MIPKVQWRTEPRRGTPLSPFASDAERRSAGIGTEHISSSLVGSAQHGRATPDTERALRVAIDAPDQSALEATLLRELGDDERSGIEVLGASAITREPYVHGTQVLTNPDVLFLSVGDGSYISDDHGFYSYHAWRNSLTRDGIRSEDAENILMTVAAAQALGIDLLATEDPWLRHYFRWKNALDFRSSLALCGLYLCYRDSLYLRAKDGRDWHISPSLARKLTTELLVPALVDIEQACHDDPLNLRWRLANSVMTRLTRGLRARDELHFRTQIGESQSISEDAAFFLDYFLVCAVGAFDSLARFINLACHLGLSHWQCAWQRKDYLDALGTRGARLAQHARKDTTQRPLRLLRELRNLVHEVAPEPQVVANDRHPLDIAGPQMPEILRAAEAVGGEGAWGLEEPGPFGGAYLWPDIFAEKATAELFRVMRELTSLVDLEQLPNPELGKRRDDISLRGIPHLLGEHAAQRLVLLAGVG